MLLERYGELVLLDATYRTTKYALPLFIMVVRTNVGYTPVATFICESETTAHIAEALSIIKEWNLRWKPRFFMIDYSEPEYQALQDVFPEAHKYVCSFHREQAWIRWCREGKNQLTTDNQHHLLKMLRDIATANSKEKCDKGIHILRSSKLYASNNRVKAYTETRWLGICQEVQYKSCLRDDQEVGTGSPVQQEDETDISGEEASTCNRYIHSTQKCLREKLKVRRISLFSPLMLMSCQMSSPNSHWHVLNWNRPYREKASCLYTSLARNQPFVHCLKERKR
ncbi:hypothetical protein BSL78_15345 [Apostichopus japonicus]|uniref:ZSWIM1/3 RNaseH-like domain-containing protein n=1 Tax=Stichopus japonicus TaxID=307972 RepID=A0A2G8KII4_STIJA|nr:hypothetical protein BSL78_15345 [Apostichopus japonicus]